jgi:nicotinate-nucleotide adenylyltransferase
MTPGLREHTAVFGGSFNPPHQGHVIAVRSLLELTGVRRVKVVPSFGTPLKETGVPYPDRLAMARIAFEGIAEVDGIEGEHRIEFTWQLLEVLKTGGEPLAFVMGSDQLESLPRWNRFPQVLSQCDWIVIGRKPGGLDRAERAAAALAAGGILKRTDSPGVYQTPGRASILRLCETDAPELSSTRIRELLALKNKESARDLLPPGVLEYIERNKIYGT